MLTAEEQAKQRIAALEAEKQQKQLCIDNLKEQLAALEAENARLKAGLQGADTSYRLLSTRSARLAGALREIVKWTTLYCSGEQENIRRVATAALDDTPTGMVVLTADERQAVGNLLARLNGDGGHRQDEVGLKQAAEEAEARVVQMMQREADTPTAPLVTPAKSEALRDFLDAWDSGAFKKQYDPEGVLADRMWQAVEQLRDATLVTPEVREAIRRIVCPLVRERKKHRAAMSAVLLQGRPMRQQQVDVDFATLDAAGLLDGKD